MSDYLLAMLVGYVLTVAIETTVLLALLSPRHSTRTRLFAGVWLTACTYPVVWLVLPDMFESRTAYLAVAETFAPVAECLIFWFAFIRPSAVNPQPPNRQATLRDLTAIVVANLFSFAFGEVLHAHDVFPAILDVLR